MLMLSLLRHAKSSRADPALDDYSRPLTERGVTAASKIGRYLKRERLKPDLILCSGAVRARATLALVLAELESPLPEVRYDDALYHKSPNVMLELLQCLEAPCRHVMVVGHNPELHTLSLELVGGGKGKDVAALHANFPTSALAVITFDKAKWAKVRSGSGRLERFIQP